MTVGFIGLGRMGKNMVIHLLENGVSVVGYNRTQQKTDELSAEINNTIALTKFSGTFTPVFTIKELIEKMPPPRIIWIQIDAGRPVDQVIDELLIAGISSNDIVIDGGNSYYKESVGRFDLLREKNIHFVDCGVSGGLEGARYGAGLMIGGEKLTYEKLIPLLTMLAGKQGTHTYFGQSGAGHYVKMVHNGVEYGMLQAIGEGFELLHRGSYPLNLHAVASNWVKGSVVRGWLMDLLEQVLSGDPSLEKFQGKIGGGETGDWTLATAKELNINMPALEQAVDMRQRTQDHPTFTGKIIAALRWQFGRHV